MTQQNNLPEKEQGRRRHWLGDLSREPYHRVFIPDGETSIWSAYIEEFLGCITEGDSLLDAAQRLNSAAEAWVEACYDSDYPIPSPRAYNAVKSLETAKAALRKIAEAEVRFPPEVTTMMAVRTIQSIASRALRDLEAPPS